MILALDNGLATLGWAVVRPRIGTVVELGMLDAPANPHLDDAIDRARRAFDQAHALSAIARKHGCTTFVGEAMSFGGSPRARFAMAVSLGLSWGVLCGVAYELGAQVLAVPPKVWQLAVLDQEDGKVDYDKLFAALSRFVKGGPREQLAAIPKRHRNHAIDAVGIGLYTARCGAPVIAKGRAA